ncbi:hypothetical protein JQ633_06710 [Bradyrhizobium tropiciagri]|uniref:hypothetical protein n=1 Tax=Bradyrhizobium tropiciagri TaxID=312253 RepID=UPI001BA4B8A9|nr:hypothetical protein [Bradyrhizobium tropiciagri]MBR0870041.1 hypothetical protein [Bradyrhizobium tropiciagri]
MTFEAASRPAAPISMHMGTEVDASRLSDRAVSRLTSLRQRVADLHAQIPSFEQIKEQADAKAIHSSRIEQLRKPRSEGGFQLDETAPQVMAEGRRLELASAQLARLTGLYETRGERWSLSGQLARAVTDWLTQGGIPLGVVLEDVEDDDVAELLKPKETIADGIERYRLRLRELKADLHRIRSAPYPSAGAKSAMREQIAALAVAAAPNVDGAIEFGQPVQFATSRLTANIYNANSPGVIGFGETHDAVGLVAWLFRDQLVAALEREIDAAADDAAALTREQREVQEAAVLQDILAIERREVALIFVAEAQGTIIDFRPDTSPQALLGVRLVTAPRQASGSSPEHAWDVAYGRR